MPIPREDGKNIEYVRAVYFDYNGLLWIIEAKCDKDMMEQIKTDLNHILKTFKILN